MGYLFKYKKEFNSGGYVGLTVRKNAKVMNDHFVVPEKYDKSRYDSLNKFQFIEKVDADNIEDVDLSKYIEEDENESNKEKVQESDETNETEESSEDQKETDEIDIDKKELEKLVEEKEIENIDEANKPDLWAIAKELDNPWDWSWKDTDKSEMIKEFQNLLEAE